MVTGRQRYVIINERMTMFHWGVWHEKEKKDLNRPPEHSGTAVDVQPLPDREDGRRPIVGIGASGHQPKAWRYLTHDKIPGLTR